MLRGRDVQEIKELQRQGMSIQAISQLTGWDRKTISKYLSGGGGAGVWAARSTAEQAGRVQAVFGGAAARRGVERAGVAARTARAELHRRLHDSDGLVAAATERRARWRCGDSKRLRASRRKWTGGIWARWRSLARSRSCTVSPSRWVTAAGWWRKRRWTKSWARCCGCTKRRSSRSAECRKRFSTTA